MNLHPIFVHFPVAFLTIYTLCEFARFKFIKEKEWWFYVKAFLVIVGALGTAPSILTGSMIEDQFETKLTEPLLETHESFAFATAFLFSFIAIIYIISFLDKSKIIKTKSYLWTGLLKIKSFLIESWFIVLLALIGLVLITITGTLGGALAYGPDIDPIVSFIYGLFF